ncbi:hypothetical protein NGM99_13610 [Mesorhizobium sp. RP14(2022)]|uniref:Uncharacterized protein n=1 Tax=Mesorhizobium liriopis TaxID=2953882 RepID=A0ABT1C7L3_9HYPH|nr:hypothetical protein [Mesorhizobium liriopis]MCO6050815.1 hypothetical protein [Mesorhizobium liriopis]
MISDYPEPKIKVSCEKCGRRAQYDRDAMIKAGGDRRLLDLLDAIQERLKCETLERDPDIYNKCRLKYENIRPATPNAYEQARDG